MKQTLKRLFSFFVNVLTSVRFVVLIFATFVHDCAVANDDRRPSEHFCPITYEVMKDPVVAADGHSYERFVILEHFRINEHSLISPLGVPLKSRELFDNHALKVMIEEWKPGKQSEPSVLEMRDASSIAQQVKEEFSKNAILLNSSKDRHIVVFLGSTGAGKSTLVNLLAEKEVVVSDDGGHYVLANPGDQTAMAIGTGGHSETIYPKFVDVNGLRFFDLPGFNDTDSSERNLVNAAFIRKILLDAASVRLVFVVGEDQFTVDRGASVRQLFGSIRQLFVIDHENMNIVDDGIFVATKVTRASQAEITDFLLRLTDSKDKAVLNRQLKLWSDRNRLGCMFHLVQNARNRGMREQILGLIRGAKPVGISGINVNVLYPSDTKEPLERMFLSVLEGAFNLNLVASLTDLSDKECYDYDKAIGFYEANTFWSTFEANVPAEKGAIELLKEFCVNPYHKALKRFEKENEGKRREHVKILEDRRKERAGYIEKTFFDLLDGVFDRNIDASLITLSDYNEAIVSYGSDTFWPMFGATVSVQEDTVDLLKKFCREHYDKALTILEKENEWKRQKYFQSLKDKRKKRIKDIERRTDERTREVIASLVSRSEGGDFVAFDFAYHKDYYDRICGPGSIQKLATDLKEQEVVHRYYVDFISRHICEQVMRWHQNFRGIERELTDKIDELTGQLRGINKLTGEIDGLTKQQMGTMEEKLTGLTIPLVVRGYEPVYERFLKGALVYRPNGDGNDDGMVTLPISELRSPLGESFDLSRCGDTGKYLSISTGYRKGKRLENGGKVRIWFAPRFLIERELNGTAKHFQPIFNNWKEAAGIGVFWTWDGAPEGSYMDYLTTENMDDLSKNNLYNKWRISKLHRPGNTPAGITDAVNRIGCIKNFMFVLKKLESARVHQENSSVKVRLVEEEKSEERNPLVDMSIPVPLVAQGYERIYERFLSGALLYRPSRDNDAGMIAFLIRNLANPLEETFDLSRCGDTSKYLSISTGYRKGKRPENANKTEIWFAPRFLIEKELKTTAKHFEHIYGNWKEQAEVGMFWTKGEWDDLTRYDYLTTENMGDLSKINLYENWIKHSQRRQNIRSHGRRVRSRPPCMWLENECRHHFYVNFAS